MALPYGWTEEDLDQASDLALSYGAAPDDILGIWYSESGLNPRNSNLGYYGLIMGRDDFVAQTAGMQAGTWRDIVENGKISTQLLAIKRFWDAQIRGWLGARAGQEEYAIQHRAAQLGVTPAGLLYALNFVPAWAVRMKTADQPMVRSAEMGGGDPNAQDSEARYYKDNPLFDITNPRKGYISMRDMDLRISALKDRALASNARSLLLSTSNIVPVGFVTYSSEERPLSPPRERYSPWPAIFGIGVVFTAIGVGLHYLNKAIPDR